ncbi:DNA-directed RNA polymerase I subunit rpa49 [Varicellaria rhodocarpa]|nr:DNA-directed RNA polymerase I subunit rpa49 [Varicellaria rhodocarpa]
MSEKKRKRTSEEIERPSKKRVEESIAETLKFSILQDTSDWAPAITTSPGLSLPTTLLMKAYKKPQGSSNESLRRVGRSLLSTSELLLYSSANPTLDHVAREESTGTDNLMKHYIAVYDPKTGNVQLVEARKLVLRSLLRSSESLHDTEAEKDDKPNRLSARSILGETFGTKKAQKAIKALTENAIASPMKSSASGSLDAASSAVLESMSQTSTIAPSREDLQALVDESKPIPLINQEAKTPAEVYTPESLIGMDSLVAINVRTWEEAINNGEDVKTSSLFVSKRLKKIVEEKDVKKLKILRYILLLLDWRTAMKSGQKGLKKLPPKEDMKNAVGEDIRDSILDSVRRKFAPDFALNKRAIDFFSTHVCALTLHVDNYEVDTYDIREDLKLDPKQ